MSVAGVNGIVLTKLDGTAKGGVAVAIAHDLKLPIRYVGVGEGHRRSRAVFGATSTWTVCSRRNGGDGPSVTCDADYMDARAVSRRARAAAARVPIRWSARSSCRPTASSSARAFTSAPASRTPRCTRSTRPATGARRDAVLHARAVLPLGPHRSVRRPHRRGRHRARRRRGRGSESRSCAGSGFAYLRAHGVEVEVGLGARTARRAEPAVLHADARAAAVRRS